MKNSISNFELSKSKLLMRWALILTIVSIMISTTFYFYKVQHAGLTILYLGAWFLLVYLERKGVGVMIFSSMVSGTTLICMILLLIDSVLPGPPPIWLSIFFLCLHFSFGSSSFFRCTV